MSAVIEIIVRIQLIRVAAVVKDDVAPLAGVRVRVAQVQEHIGQLLVENLRFDAPEVFGLGEEAYLELAQLAAGSGDHVEGALTG